MGTTDDRYAKISYKYITVNHEEDKKSIEINLSRKRFTTQSQNRDLHFFTGDKGNVTITANRSGNNNSVA